MDINNYDRLNKKYIFSLYIVAFFCSIFVIISIVNLKGDMEFYKNSEQVNCIVKNKENKDKENIIQVSYNVGDNNILDEIVVSDNDFNSIHIGDKMEIFYNKSKPNECRMTTRSITNILIIMLILFFIQVASIVIAIFYSIRIRTNKELIISNNVIETKFSRLEFKNSIFGNQRINYVYCKANVNGEKKKFKSIGFTNKPKPLNDTSVIRVYIDDKNNYLVNIYDLIEE